MKPKKAESTEPSAVYRHPHQPDVKVTEVRRRGDLVEVVFHRHGHQLTGTFHADTLRPWKD